MRLVVDTNVLLTFSWRDSFTRGLLADRDLGFFAPEFALHEVNEHRGEAMERTGLSPAEFEEAKRDLAMLVEFVPLEEYSGFLQRASAIPDKDDVDFVALALKLGLPLWSNDARLKEQSLVRVLSTRELVEVLARKKP